MVTQVAHALWVAGSLFLVLLGFLVLATRPGAMLNRVLGALLVLRGASDLFYELMRDAATPADALLAHRVANWYDWPTLFLTLWFLHLLSPPRAPRARRAVLAAAALLTVLLMAAFVVDPGLFREGVVKGGGAFRVETPAIPLAFTALTAAAQLAAVALAARDVAAPDLTVLQRRRAALTGLAFALLLGQGGLPASVSLFFPSANDAVASGGVSDMVLAVRALLYGAGFVLVVAVLPRLAGAFEGWGRAAVLVAGASALLVGTAVGADRLFFEGTGVLLFAVDPTFHRVPFAVLSAACLGLAIVRYGLAGFGAPTQRRVAQVARFAIPLSLALLPVGALLAFSGADSLVLGAAMVVALGAATFSPAPLRAASDRVTQLVLVDPADPGHAAERARRYAAELARRRGIDGRMPDAADPGLAALRRELGLGDADHPLLAALLPEPSERGEPPLLGRYRVERELGRGAFGTASLALDIATGRRVVLKRFHADGMEARALAEARAMAAVRHPRVVPLLAVERVGREVFLVLAYAEGGTLQHLLHREGALPPRRAAALLADVLEGLEAVHAAGLAHGDVKPENVLLDAEGRALVGDLGSARPAQRPAEEGTLTASPVLGSLATMPPELLRGARRSPAGDVYACGATLYRLLTGDHYLDLAGKDWVGATEAILHGAPRLPHRRVPPALEEVLAKALAKEPAERFPDAGAMRAALLAAAGP